MPSNEYPLWSKLLRKAREEKGMIQTEVAEMLGVEPPTYRNAETGRGGLLVVNRISRVHPEIASEIIDAYNAAKGKKAPIEIDEDVSADPLTRGVAEAGLTRFFPSRQYYRTLRDGRDSIGSYIAQTTNTVEMVSISLATGMELERVIDVFCEILQRPEETAVKVSLLDYKKPYLMKAIAPVIGSKPDSLALRIQDTITNLRDFSDEKLSNSARSRFEVWCHNVIPNASAIMLDADLPSGLIQLETKGYKMGMYKSFGFECAAGTEFYSNLRDSYRHLIVDGRRIL